MLKYSRAATIVVFSAILYILLLYFTPRERFFQVYTLYIGLFSGYVMLIYPYLFNIYGWKIQRNTLLGDIVSTIPFIICIGILFRIIALGSIPELSDDYFRFIWDGRLLAQGINPFIRLPAEYMESPLEAKRLGLSREVFDQLNSPEYYTIYPPLNQFIFWITAFLSSGNFDITVLGMKSFLFLAEVGTLVLLPRILVLYGYPKTWSAIYAFNPLVIIELIGNLHFEALLIFFLLLSIYWLHQGQWLMASFAFGLSIASKLLPVIFLPLLIRRLGIVKTLLFSLIALGVNVLLFIPLLDTETFLNMADSIGLYFQSFEFNASIYYLVRWIGYQIRGYNVIQIVGKYLAVTVFLGVWLITFFERSPNWKSLPRTMTWVLTLYFAFASIVHPWYITTILALSCISRLRFTVVWSLMIMVSYFTYRNTLYEENLWFTALEYLVVAAFAGIDLWKSIDLRVKL